MTNPTEPENTGNRAVTRQRALGFPDLREEVDRRWEAVMTPSRPFRTMSRVQPLPAIDVFEKDGHLHIRAELPGMMEKDVQISISGDALLISGEKKEESEVKEENYYRSERTYGKFERQVALPASADTANSTAKFKDGILEIDIPIKAEVAKKTIRIERQDFQPE